MHIIGFIFLFALSLGGLSACAARQGALGAASANAQSDDYEGFADYSRGSAHP
jgi:hypothetical protein